MPQGKPRDPRKEQHWRQLLERWLHSGLSERARAPHCPVQPGGIVPIADPLLISVPPGRGGAHAPPLPQIRTCPIKASGSSCHNFAA